MSVYFYDLFFYYFVTGFYLVDFVLKKILPSGAFGSFDNIKSSTGFGRGLGKMIFSHDVILLIINVRLIPIAKSCDSLRNL